MIGIYKITSPFSKIYIGQSWNIENRFKKYKYLSCKTQIKLYNSLLKYGWLNHKFEVIDILDYSIATQELLDKKEIYYWKKYKNLNFKLLNIKNPGSKGKHSQETKDKIGNSNKGKIGYLKGKHRSEETKKKISESQKGEKAYWYKISMNSNPRCKPVIQLDLESNFIKEWISAREVYNELNISYKHICDVCKNKRKTCGGFKWKYK